MISYGKHCISPQMAVIAAGIVIWFVSFPDDLEAVMTPIRTLLALASETLQLTNSISPFAYGLASVALVCVSWRTDRASQSTKSSQS